MSYLICPWPFSEKLHIGLPKRMSQEQTQVSRELIRRSWIECVYSLPQGVKSHTPVSNQVPNSLKWQTLSVELHFLYGPDCERMFHVTNFVRREQVPAFLLVYLFRKEGAAEVTLITKLAKMKQKLTNSQPWGLKYLSYLQGRHRGDNSNLRFSISSQPQPPFPPFHTKR